MFWILVISLAVVTGLFIAFPLWLKPKGEPTATTNDAMVYRDQLEEVTRDEQAGLIAGDEARQAKSEIARRLIAASDSKNQPERTFGPRVVLALTIFIVVFVPLTGLFLYQGMGHPNDPDQPLSARLHASQPDINILIAHAEDHLATNPDDAKGWELMAKIYTDNMRLDDAANAWKNVIRILGPSAERYGAIGEMLTMGAGGQVTPDARDAFNNALKLNPKDPRARFYTALGDAQIGKFDQALSELKALKDQSPADAPWIAIVDTQMQQVATAKSKAGDTPGNPTASDVQAAAGMDAEDRMAMIRTMVDGLDERLKTQPNNIEGWIRLVKSYGVLNEPAKAEDALKRALAAFPADSENGKSLIALAKDMGLTIPEAGK
jgi:cytochrome c-type biogenesis protein CcmH